MSTDTTGEALPAETITKSELLKQFIESGSIYEISTGLAVAHKSDVLMLPTPVADYLGVTTENMDADDAISEAVGYLLHAFKRGEPDAKDYIGYAADGLEDLVMRAATAASRIAKKCWTTSRMLPFRSAKDGLTRASSSIAMVALSTLPRPRRI